MPKYYWTNYISTDSSNTMYTATSTSQTTTVITNHSLQAFVRKMPIYSHQTDDPIGGFSTVGDYLQYKAKADQPFRIHLKDGGVFQLNADASYEIIDKDQKVTYKANNIREFNKYLNASDLIEEFIRFLGKHKKVRQSDILSVPIETFINFLIYQSAIADGLEPEQQTYLRASRLPRLAAPRCGYCQRFVRRDLAMRGLGFCNKQHMILAAEKFPELLALPAPT